MKPSLILTLTLAFALLAGACKKDEPGPPAPPAVPVDTGVHQVEIRITCPAGYWYDVLGVAEGYTTNDTVIRFERESGQSVYSFCTWEAQHGTHKLYVDGQLRLEGTLVSTHYSLIDYIFP